MDNWAGIDVEGAASRRPVPGSDARRLPGMHPSGRLVLGSIDRGGRLLQRRAGVIVVGSAFFVVPVLVMELVALWVTFDNFERFDGIVVSVPELVGGVEAATGVETTMWYLSLLLNSLSVALVGGFVATVALDDRFGRPPSLSRSLRLTVRRLPTLIAAWCVGHCWVLLAALITVQSSGDALIAWAIFGGLVAAIPTVLTLLVSPVVMIEGSGVRASLRRSARLVKARRSGCVGFVIGAGLVGLWVRAGITALPTLAEATGFVTFGSLQWLADGFAGQVARLLAAPLVGAATAALYLELRMDAEGMDISIEADRAFGSRA